MVTSDPERLSSAASSELPLERSLLASMRGLSVPDHARAQVWGALSMQLLHTSGAAAAAAAAAPKAGWAALRVVALKAALVAPVLAGAVAFGMHQHGLAKTEGPPAPVAVATAHPPAVAPEPASEGVAEPTEVSADLDTPRARALPSQSAKDRLARESALLTRARAELRSGNPAAASATLQRMQRELGSGSLRQERDVLDIETLAAGGHAGAAERLARAFIAAHPESPHSEPLRRFIRTP